MGNFIVELIFSGKLVRISLVTSTYLGDRAVYTKYYDIRILNVRICENRIVSIGTVLKGKITRIKATIKESLASRKK